MTFQTSFETWRNPRYLEWRYKIVVNSLENEDYFELLLVYLRFIYYMKKLTVTYNECLRDLNISNLIIEHMFISQFV